MERPNNKDYGYHEQQGPDDLPSGWYLEGGEEAYDKAHELWLESLSKASGDTYDTLAKYRKSVPSEAEFQSQFLVGTDTYDIPTLILVKRTGKVIEVILEGKVRDKVAFEEVIKNLTHYFNAVRVDT